MCNLLRVAASVVFSAADIGPLIEKPHRVEPSTFLSKGMHTALPLEQVTVNPCEAAL